MYAFDVYYSDVRETIARPTYTAINGAQRYFDSRGYYCSGIEQDQIIAGKVARNRSAVFSGPNYEYAVQS